MFEKIIKFLGWGKPVSNYRPPVIETSPAPALTTAQIEQAAPKAPKPLPPKGSVVKADKPKPKKPMPRKKPVAKKADAPDFDV